MYNRIYLSRFTYFLHLSLCGYEKNKLYLLYIKLDVELFYFKKNSNIYDLYSYQKNHAKIGYIFRNRF